jgi:hypothetical protein
MVVIFLSLRSQILQLHVFFHFSQVISCPLHDFFWFISFLFDLLTRLLLPKSIFLRRSLLKN